MRRSKLRFVTEALAAFLAISGFYESARCDDGGRALRPVAGFELSDLDGSPHTMSKYSQAKAVVAFVMGLECPVANFQAAVMNKLADNFRPQGVIVVGVHPDPDVTPEAARAHAKDYKLKFPVLLDPHHRLTSQLAAKVLGQVVVFLPSGEIVYRGRIDDRFTLDGKRRDEPSKRDLVEAIEAVLAGARPTKAEIPAFGCPLPRPRPPVKSEKLPPVKREVEHGPSVG